MSYKLDYALEYDDLNSSDRKGLVLPSAIAVVGVVNEAGSGLEDQQSIFHRRP